MAILVNYTPSGGPLAAAATDTQLSGAFINDTIANSYTISATNVLLAVATAIQFSNFLQDVRAGSSTLPSSIQSTVVFNATTDSAYMYCRGQSQTGPISSSGTLGYVCEIKNNTLTIYKHIAGTFTSLVNTAWTTTVGTAVTVLLTCTGASPTTITATIPAQSVTLTTTDSTVGPQVAGYMGFFVASQSTTTGITNITTANTIAGAPSAFALAGPTVTNGSSTITCATTQSGGTVPVTYKLYASTVSALDTTVPAIPAGTLVYTGTTPSFVYTPPNGNPVYFRWSATDSTATPVTVHSSQVVGILAPLLFIGAIGDSITAGSGATGGLDVCSLLATAIMAESGSRNVTVTNRGISGTTTADWAPASANFTNAMTAIAAVAGTNPLYVQIMLGTNDTKTTNRFTQATYQANLLAIVNAIKAYAGINLKGVVLHDAPFIVGPLTGFDEQSNALILQYRTAIANLVDNVIVLQGDTLAYNVFVENSATYFADNLHPNNAGHQALAYAWANVYANLLNPIAKVVIGSRFVRRF